MSASRCSWSSLFRQRPLLSSHILPMKSRRSFRRLTYCTSSARISSGNTSVIMATGRNPPGKIWSISSNCQSSRHRRLSLPVSNVPPLSIVSISSHFAGTRSRPGSVLPFLHPASTITPALEVSYSAPNATTSVEYSMRCQNKKSVPFKNEQQKVLRLLHQFR